MAISHIKFISCNIKSTLISARLLQVVKFGIRVAKEMSTMAVNPNDRANCQAPGLLKVLEGNPKRLKRIKFLGSLFETNGYELRIAGGAVRDILRGKEPVDIDFATTARPEQSLDLLNKHKDIFRIIVTSSGRKHGTVAVKFKECELDFKRIKLDAKSEANDSTKTKQPLEPEYDRESPYEITTLRCDKFTDGRHAEVEFINDWRKDAERRDLTINAMFLTLNDGRLIDYFGGESDLKEGIVRFVGDADLRIREDYLRIMRYFRFWSRYGCGKQPDSKTMLHLQRNLDGLDRISGERIWQEIKKTLSYLPCLEVVKLMLKLKAFDHAGLLDPDTKDYDAFCGSVLAELEQAQKNVGFYLESTIKPKLEQDPEDIETRRLKDLLPVILFASLVQTDKICMNSHSRMKFSNLERDTILYIIENRNKSPSLDAFKYQLAMSNNSERSQTMQRIQAYCVTVGNFDYITRLKSWVVPHFPVSGTIVAQQFKQRKLPANKMKLVIEALKLDWAMSNYSLNQEELLELLPAKLDSVAKKKQ